MNNPNTSSGMTIEAGNDFEVEHKGDLVNVNAVYSVDGGETWLCAIEGEPMSSTLVVFTSRELLRSLQ